MTANRLKDGLQRSASRLKTYMGSFWQKKSFDENTWEAVETSMLASNLGVAFTEKFLTRLKKARPEDGSLQEQLALEIENHLKPYMCPFPDIPQESDLQVCMLVGVNGSGKTTTAGKLATWYQTRGYEVGLVNADLFRAAAPEQARIWAKQSGVSFYTDHGHKDGATVVYEAYVSAQKDGKNLLIVDTAGRLHTEKNLMNELEKITRVLRKHDVNAPQMCFLVLDGTVGQNALSQAALFQTVTPLTGLIITKLDGTSKAGVAVPLVEALKLPIVGIGVGEGASDLQVPDPRLFARSLLGVEET